MNIRKGNRDDMHAVLGLIQELAEFENEPNAVLVTVDDLIRDGFGPNPLFHVFVAVFFLWQFQSTNGKRYRCK